MKKLLIALLSVMCVCVGCEKQDDFVDMQEEYKSNSPYQQMYDKIVKETNSVPDAIDEYLETLIEKEDLADGEERHEDGSGADRSHGVGAGEFADNGNVCHVEQYLQDL